MRKASAGVVLFVTVIAGGCADDESTPAASESSDGSSPSTDSSTADESSPGADGSTEAAPSVAGDALPEAMIGTFQRFPDEFFAFYEPDDEICADTVGTAQNCYAVIFGKKASAEPVELGVAAIEGDVLNWVPTKDPSCVGVLNRAKWAETAKGVTLTPTRDCHGLGPVKLVRLP